MKLSTALFCRRLNYANSQNHSPDLIKRIEEKLMSHQLCLAAFNVYGPLALRTKFWKKVEIGKFITTALKSILKLSKIEKFGCESL